MSDPPPPTAQELVKQLTDYALLPGTPDELVQLLRPPRLALRSSPSFRKVYGSIEAFWLALQAVWRVQADRFTKDDKECLPAVTALAAFLLSLCTQEPRNQASAVQHIEPELRRILLHASSLFNLEDADYQPTTRLLTQALANLVTANEDVASTFFPARLELEARDNLLQRLLATPDQGTLQAVLIFLLNSIHSNRGRALLLGTSTTGAALLDRLMVLVGAMFDDESPESITKQENAGGVFGLTFAIVQQLVTLGVFAETYAAHPLMPDFSTSPTLVTLLKLLDGHLSTSTSSSTSPSSLALVHFLLAQLSYLTSALIPSEGKEDRKEAADAAVFQGVVLVLHCLSSIGLGLDKELGELENRGVEGDQLEATKEKAEAVKGEMIGAVEDVVRLLHFAQTLLPPPGPRPSPDAASLSIPQPAAPSPATPIHPSDRFTSLSSSSSAAASPPLPVEAIAQLQRTSTSLLGILAFSSLVPTVSNPYPVTKGAAKKAQDEVREKGGLGVLLGMCQIDERNPTMREHALFAIRTLLKGNQANQDFVDGIKPQYMVGKGGELLDLPPALRKE
ncbi:hypothetical protein JCM11251_003838 [Rhodosporidiobolus azoricus]